MVINKASSPYLIKYAVEKDIRLFRIKAGIREKKELYCKCTYLVDCFWTCLPFTDTWLLLSVLWVNCFIFTSSLYVILPMSPPFGHVMSKAQSKAHRPQIKYQTDAAASSRLAPSCESADCVFTVLTTVNTSRHLVVLISNRNGLW